MKKQDIIIVWVKNVIYIIINYYLPPRLANPTGEVRRAICPYWDVKEENK